MEDVLWYKTPATRFSEALPVGNGSLGAMVYGNFPEMKLTLNRDTLWSGRPERGKIAHVEEKDRQRVRELISQKKFFEAKGLMQDTMLGDWTESYVSAAFLHVCMRTENGWRGDGRYLHMKEASACARGVSGTCGIRTEVISSFADDIVLIRMEADCPISMSISMDSVLRFSSCVRKGDLLLFGEAPAHVEPNYVESEEPVIYGGGMAFGVLVKVTEHDGILSAVERSIVMEKVKKVTILCSVQTGFRGYDSAPDTDAEKIVDICRQQIGGLESKKFKELKNRHLAVYSPLYQRISLELENQEEIGRLFQYGRYLMLCSSYPQNQYTQPANLQGIWCEDIRPVWSCNWTTNINIEMNYWITGPCALAECEIPLIQMIKELAEVGKETARETCGCRGWALFHNTDIWRQTAPSRGEVKYAFWPMAGVWLSTHLYQHYLFTQDDCFLRFQAYPVMKAAAEFCVDWLQEDEMGNFYTSPSTSPENEFLDGQGRACPVSSSSTMDIVLVRELLANTEDAARRLSVDLEFANRIERIKNHLPQFAIGKYGQLQEWGEDFEEADPGHRHMAHMAGLHPFFQITLQKTPELAAASRRSLEQRIKNNPQCIGWTEAWLTNLYARLADGEKALEHLELFLKHCTYKNLMSLHPKLGESYGEREIFQIDGNFGITAGIAEMLLQSYGQTILLLPALPDAWKNGKVSGLRTRSGCRVQIEWKDGVIHKACIIHLVKGKIMIRYRHSFYIELPEGEIMVSGQSGDYAQVEYVGKAGMAVVVRLKD